MRIWACAAKKVENLRAKVRSRGRWHARSAKNPPHRCRCPGVSNQYALSTALNTCFNNLRGGPPGPPTPRGLNLVRPCWLHFSLLGASWAHSLSLAALVVALRRFLCVLGRSGLDFGGFRPGFGRVFGWFFGLKIHAKGNLKKIV